MLAAAAPPETRFFAFGANTYSAGILDEPPERAAARCPVLFQPPAVADAFAYRLFRRRGVRSEISATVVSTNLLECDDGPEIAIHPGQLRLDLLRALYLTDALHRAPQTLDEGPPLETLPPPTFDALEILPALP